MESITNAVNVDLARSKALLAYYSQTYPLRRACQCELTAVFLARQCAGDPRKRVLIVNPETKADHIHPIELRDARFFAAPKNDEAALQALANIVLQHVRDHITRTVGKLRCKLGRSMGAKGGERGRRSDTKNQQHTAKLLIS
jgi:hypothetical protein